MFFSNVEYRDRSNLITLRLPSNLAVVVPAELFVFLFIFGQVTVGNDESVHVRRRLTGDDDGRGMGPTPTTTYDGWDDPSTAGEGILAADTEEEGYYIHIGCFADDREDRVLGHMKWADDMTAKVRNVFFFRCWCEGLIPALYVQQTYSFIFIYLVFNY